MRVLLPLIAALTLATPALAQPSGPQGARGMMPGGVMMMQGGMSMCPMAGHTEGTLAFLKTELAITTAQTQTWETFASAYRTIAASRGAMMGPGMMGQGMMGQGAMGPGMMGYGPMGPGAMGPGMMSGDERGAAKPLPDRLALHTQMMERRLEAAKKLQAAIQPLYAALDAKQKKTADEVMPMITMMCM